MLEGIDRQEFAQQTGFTIEQLAGAAISAHVAGERLAWTGDRLRLTRQGLLVSDSIWPDLI